MTSSEPESNWAWLGLLKWSLSYVDGTVPSEESPNFKQMSEEDKAFLEEVMKHGIIDEGERMKVILAAVVKYLESVQHQQQQQENNATDNKAVVADQSESEGEITTLLEELQDIVEQIDFAKSFAAMGGLPFLLGCATERTCVPTFIRSSCLAILATLCQNNPAVQLMMLEQGNLPKLIGIYFAEEDKQDDKSHNDDANLVRAKAIQALSCCVRSHDIGETIYCKIPEGVQLIESGLGLHPQIVSNPMTKNLRLKALFFLQALVTSETTDKKRIQSFERCVQYAASRFCDVEKEEEEGSDSHIRTLTLTMLDTMLKQKKSVNGILDAKDYLVGAGVKRVSAIRSMSDDDEEKEYCKDELELWESLILELSRAERDAEEEEEEVLLLEDRPVDDSGETLAQ